MIVKDEKLRQYGFDFFSIAQVIQMQNNTDYAGGITLENSEVSVFTKNQYKNVTDLGNQIVYSTPEQKIIPSAVRPTKPE